MATNFPGSLDALTNPTGSDKLNSPDHAGQHSDINDGMEAVQAKVGVDGSAVTSSLDYKVSNRVVSNAAISGATNTKITYDAKGLVTSGASAVLASADFVNQGAAGQYLQGNASGNPSWATPLPEVSYNSATAETTTASTTYASKVSTTFTPSTAGIWKIEFCALLGSDANGKLSKVRVALDGTTYCETALHHIKAYNDRSPATPNQYTQYSGVVYKSLTAASKTASLDWASLEGNTVRIKSAWIVATRLT